MDSKDRQIIRVLQRNGRMTNQDLAALSHSRPSMHCCADLANRALGRQAHRCHDRQLKELAAQQARGEKEHLEVFYLSSIWVQTGDHVITQFCHMSKLCFPATTQQMHSSALES